MDNPRAPQFCVFYALVKCLGLRGRETYKQIRAYLELHTKDLQQHQYLGERNPVSLFKNYINHRPKEACEKDWY